MDYASMSCTDAKRFRPAARTENSVPVCAKHTSDGATHLLVILHEQDGFRSLAGWTPADTAASARCSARSGQPHCDGCPFSRLCLHINRAAGFPDDLLYSCQSQAIATTWLFGREKRFEEMRACALVHSASIVGDRNHDGSTETLLACNVDTAGARPIAGCNLDVAAFRQCV